MKKIEIVPLIILAFVWSIMISMWISMFLISSALENNVHLQGERCETSIMHSSFNQPYIEAFVGTKRKMMFGALDNKTLDCCCDKHHCYCDYEKLEG
jgi:hypothetical protein